jgi:ribosomal protein S18 acetylase RimI-like enzyme
VRAARSADTRQIVELGERSAGTSVWPGRPASTQRLAASFRALFEMCRARSDARILVAELDARFAGFLILVLHLLDEVTRLDQAFVAYMAVEPDARRRGVAKALLAAAEEQARSSGLQHISLMVTHGNEAARRLYASLGFADERVQMTKRLGAQER